MAANYWRSTQYNHWTFTKAQLASARRALEETDASAAAMYPLPDARSLGIFFHAQVNKLAKRLSVRQQVVASSQVYLKRFYTRVDMRRTNAYLLVATSVYLASKMEESPHHIRFVATEARALWPEFLGHLDTSRMGECEFFLISEMNCNLIVHQPYRMLSQLQAEMGLTMEEAKFAQEIVNDHYMGDLPLLYAPHVVALTGILLALVLRKNGTTVEDGAGTMAAAAAVLTMGGRQAGPAAAAAAAATTTTTTVVPGRNRYGKTHRFALWLAESEVDIEAMIDCTQELISLYSTIDMQNEKHTRDQVNRYIKARGLDK